MSAHVPMPRSAWISPALAVILWLTSVISMLTFGTGRTNVLFGLIHLVVLAVFIFLVFEP